MRYSAILFDLDDTLYDGTKPWLYSISRMADYLSKRYPQVDFSNLNDVVTKVKLEAKKIAPDSYSFAVRPLLFRNILNHYQLDYSWKDITHMEDIYTQYYLEGIEPIEGVEELVAELSEEYMLLILTDFTFGDQVRRVNQLNLSDYFDDIITAQEVGALKKSGRLHKIAVERYQLVPERVLMVGDTVHSDIVPAKELGMGTVLVPNVLFPPTEEDKATADHYLDSVVDIRSVL